MSKNIRISDDTKVLLDRLCEALFGATHDRVIRLGLRILEKNLINAQGQKISPGEIISKIKMLEEK